MQNRYVGDIGDYVKLAILRALSPDHFLGVAWYLFPDEAHNADGRHINYLNDPDSWRRLDPELFDFLGQTVRGERSVEALESRQLLESATFFRENLRMGMLPASQRSSARNHWFDRAINALDGCDLVFADPDNGLIDDAPQRRRQSKFGKQMPLSEALAIADGRQTIIYHHNTRFPGGHDMEVRHWQRQLGPKTIAIRANAYSCRTFFVVNPKEVTRKRVLDFCQRWSEHKVCFNEEVTG